MYVQNNWDLPALEGPRDYLTTSVRAITVEKAKAANNKLRTAYAPTVLSILGGGLERLFEEACLPVPKHLITGAPFPLPDHPGGLVNHVIPTYFPWRIQARSAVERAQDIESEMNKLSNPVITTVQSALIEITGTLPTFLLKPIASSLNSRCSVGASIFPVFDAIKKPTLNQIQYMEACVGSPGKSIGTTVVACGINGDQRIVFIMDRRVFPDEKLFQLFGKYVEEELESILSNA
ncbi:unnamed protein product [Allacma fusca]|uniref:O-acyltransferase WSD1 C-terminal domain-containing protein n=1 Tax=Allacma fusca TaxID=39272 RepID=A0A8J2JG85_9HEXA|nr:unnamed protein product [Allacma fusca]